MRISYGSADLVSSDLMSRSPSGVPAGDTGRFMSPNGSPPGCTPRFFRPRSLIAILEPRRRTRWRTPRPALEQIQADSGSISIMIGLVIVTHGRQIGRAHV